MRVLVECDTRRLPFQRGELWAGGVVTDIAKRITLRLPAFMPDGTRGSRRVVSGLGAIEATRVRVVALSRVGTDLPWSPASMKPLSPCSCSA